MRVFSFIRLRRFSAAALLLLGAFVTGGELRSGKEHRRPNILFIAVDDLNDWVEPLGGHPQARTPVLSRFARQAVTFGRSYCASPGCNPSRAAVMTGRHTYRSGMYSNYQDWRKAIPNAVTLGECLRKHGYWSAGAGKIFHYTQVAPACWDAYYPSQEKNMPDYHYPRPGSTVNMPRFPGMYGDFDWSPIPLEDGETGDGRCVSWVCAQLARQHDRPFFLACGIYRPHVPWYVPQKYFDLFPLEEIKLPRVLENDLDDLGERARELAGRGGNYHRHVLAAGQWKRAVQGYLASIAFADAQVGRLLEGLRKSPHADRTIVVIWSDHGWQLGEKKHWRKFALWDNLARTVLFMRVPGGTNGLPAGTPPGSRCDRTVSLVDLYPTLIELCGLPEKDDLDGRSLVPLLRDPRKAWPYPAITTYDYGEYSVRTERWRYIRYIDDSEELYDHDHDPEEWTNLSGSSEHTAIRRYLSTFIPKNPAPLRKSTLIPLQPHHLPPYGSREAYRRHKGREAGG